MTYLSKVLLHNLGAVVDSQDDIRAASSSQGLDLVQNHGLVTELNQRLGKSQGLITSRLVSKTIQKAWHQTKSTSHVKHDC